LCRPAVFYFNEKQKEALFLKMEKIKSQFENPLLTQVKPFKPDNFTLVEEKYRRYYENNPKDGYCLSLIDPKINKMKNELKHLFVNLVVKDKK
jgi:peptide-methionine (S)-S-oxide reductase